MLCNRCGTPIEAGRLFCTKCGAGTTPPRRVDPIRLIFGIALCLAGLMVLGALLRKNRPSEADHLPSGASAQGNASPDAEGPTYRAAAPVPQRVVAEPSRIQIPAEEQAFLAAVQQGQSAFRAAPNDMAKGGTRSLRRDSICKSLTGMAISNWVGDIEQLSSNGEGKGVLELSLADSIHVKTWNNSFSDASDGTLIAPASPLFKGLSQMKVGDLVIFSGIFIPDLLDCVKETSLSLEGSMTDPEFLFRFSSVRLASEEVPTEGGSTPSAGAAGKRGEESTGVLFSDRTYSVELIATANDIAVGNVVYAQGRIARFGNAGREDRPYAIVEDEYQQGYFLMCAMMPEEGAEVVSLYHVGEVVQVSGEYMGAAPLAGNPTMPLFSDCHVASASKSVVRHQAQ